MRSLLGAIAGGITGAAIFPLWVLLGLQSSFYSTLLSVNILVGAAGGFAGSRFSDRVGRMTEQHIVLRQTNKAFSQVTRRYAKDNKMHLLTAAQQVREDVMSAMHDQFQDHQQTGGKQ